MLASPQFPNMPCPAHLLDAVSPVSHPPSPLCCRKPLNRRFIVVEGIYANTGDLAPLNALRALKQVC